MGLKGTIINTVNKSVQKLLDAPYLFDLLMHTRRCSMRMNVNFDDKFMKESLRYVRAKTKRDSYSFCFQETF